MFKYNEITPGSSFSFTIPENSPTSRLDRYLSELFPDLSRTYFQRLIEQGAIALNGTVVKKQSQPITSNDKLIITFPTKRMLEPSMLTDLKINVSVIATTEHFMVINKPAHLLVHPPSKNSPAVTLVDWITNNHLDISSIGNNDRPGIIHRLDKETSGLLVLTRTNYGHNMFGALFRNRKIKKTYKAVVSGHPEKEGIIRYAIGRDPINRIRMAFFNEENVNSVGKIGNIKVRHAETSYKVIEYFKDSSLVEVKPVTGRTHQIRVHMAALGHPIIGDQLYGKKSLLIDRQALHAETLEFSFDDKEYSFTYPAPHDFQQLIDILRVKSSQ